MIWAFEVASDDPGVSRQLYLEGLKRELLLRPIGTTVYFMPPYIIDDAEFDLLASRVAQILDTLDGNAS